SIPRVLGADRQPKDDVRDERQKRENDLLGNLLLAVVAQELKVLVMNGTNIVQLPGLYLISPEMPRALGSGWAETLRLTGRDTNWRGARLVFDEENWRQWRRSHKPGTAAKRRLSEAEKGSILQDYIERQPGGPINQSVAQPELMKL